MTRCPTCGCTAILVATVVGGDDPHQTFVCNGTKRCGKYFRADLNRVPVAHKNPRAV